MRQITITISKKKNKSKEDVDAFKTLKKLRSKTTASHIKGKIIEELIATPRKMEKIINTWAVLRATIHPTPQDSRTFNRLKNQYIDHHFTLPMKK
jgi:hypothetical protein